MPSNNAGGYVVGISFVFIVGIASHIFFGEPSSLRTNLFTTQFSTNFGERNTCYWGGSSWRATLVANNPAIRNIDRSRLQRLISSTYELVLFNHVPMFEWLENVTSFATAINFSIVLPITKEYTVVAINASLATRHHQDFVNILCKAHHVIIWAPADMHNDGWKLPNITEATGDWYTLLTILASCHKSPVKADAWERLVPFYQPLPGSVSPWPSSGFFATAWYLKQCYRTTLLGFNSADYNGLTSMQTPLPTIGHNFEFERQLFDFFINLGLLNRFKV